VGRFIASMVAPAMALIIGGSAPSSTCQRRFEKDTKTMRDFAAQVIKTRKEQPETDRKDILHAMINGF
jgi:hypothetical protein